MINTAIEAAKAAGKILMENYEKSNHVSVKSDASLVTDIDIACENKIREIIVSKYPNHGIIGEEQEDINKDADYQWVIDPLDGTHNYIFKIPIFGVSIAIAYKTEPVVGVIYFPLSDDLFTAEKGKGCFVNKKKLEIKDKPLEESLVSFSTYYFKNQSVDAREFTKKIFKNCLEIRVSGCAVFNLTGIVKNTFGGIASKSGKAWDLAAGVVMIREAGGIATDHDSNEWVLNSPNIIAGNKTCHKKILELLK